MLVCPLMVEHSRHNPAGADALQARSGLHWRRAHGVRPDLPLRCLCSVEVAGGLGPTVGKVWRIGIMGYNATEANVALVVAAFKDALEQQGYKK